MATNHPHCWLSDVYPILLRIPIAQRAAYVAAAEAGECLTREQAAALGFHPDMCDIVLMPVDGSGTPAQQDTLFAGDLGALKDIVRFGRMAVQS